MSLLTHVGDFDSSGGVDVGDVEVGVATDSAVGEDVGEGTGEASGDNPAINYHHQMYT